MGADRKTCANQEKRANVYKTLPIRTILRNILPTIATLGYVCVCVCCCVGVQCAAVSVICELVCVVV